MALTLWPPPTPAQGFISQASPLCPFHPVILTQGPTTPKTARLSASSSGYVLRFAFVFFGVCFCFEQNTAPTQVFCSPCPRGHVCSPPQVKTNPPPRNLEKNHYFESPDFLSCHLFSCTYRCPLSATESSSSDPSTGPTLSRALFWHCSSWNHHITLPFVFTCLHVTCPKSQCASQALFFSHPLPHSSYSLNICDSQAF